MKSKSLWKRIITIPPGGKSVWRSKRHWLKVYAVVSLGLQWINSKWILPPEAQLIFLAIVDYVLYLFSTDGVGLINDIDETRAGDS